MKQAHSKALVAFALVFVGSSSVVSAQEKGYVWTPSKITENAYKVRTGINVQNGWQASGGTDFSLSADEHGRLGENAARVGLWGRAVDETTDHGRTVRREIDLNMNAQSGQGQVSVKGTRRWIATEAVDVEVMRNLTLQCNSYEAHCRNASASQSVRLSVPETKTALVARSAVSSSNTQITNSFSVEQKALQNVNLNLTLDNPEKETRRGSVRASYGWRW